MGGHNARRRPRSVAPVLGASAGVIGLAALVAALDPAAAPAAGQATTAAHGGDVSSVASDAPWAAGPLDLPGIGVVAPQFERAYAELAASVVRAASSATSTPSSAPSTYTYVPGIGMVGPPAPSSAAPAFPTNSTVGTPPVPTTPPTTEAPTTTETPTTGMPPTTEAPPTTGTAPGTTTPGTTTPGTTTPGTTTPGTTTPGTPTTTEAPPPPTTEAPPPPPPTTEAPPPTTEAPPPPTTEAPPPEPLPVAEPADVDLAIGSVFTLTDPATGAVLTAVVVDPTTVTGTSYSVVDSTGEVLVAVAIP